MDRKAFLCRRSKSRKQRVRWRADSRRNVIDALILVDVQDVGENQNEKSRLTVGQAMGERLYSLRHGQGYFDTGLARGQQVLLGNTVHEIIAHWFELEGQFLQVERFPMA